MFFLELLIAVLVLSAEESKAGETESEEKWPCRKDDAIKAFKQKIQINEWPSFNGVNPYENQTAESEKHIHETLKNKEIVCAIKYQNSQKINYELRQFPSKSEADKAGFIVTHQGVCGACSNLRDLAVYLGVDLTAEQGKCTRLALCSLKEARACMQKIGFTTPCLEIALYNSLNTIKHCHKICQKNKVTGKQGYVNPDGSLQKCLQCDEEKSGPVFKYFAGRNRRNSGIESEITRPGSELYKITHCYF